jgi:hypothetical protein
MSGRRWRAWKVEGCRRRGRGCTGNRRADAIFIGMPLKRRENRISPGPKEGHRDRQFGRWKNLSGKVCIKIRDGILRILLLLDVLSSFSKYCGSISHYLNVPFNARHLLIYLSFLIFIK